MNIHFPFYVYIKQNKSKQKHFNAISVELCNKDHTPPHSNAFI